MVPPANGGVETKQSGLRSIDLTSSSVTTEICQLQLLSGGVASFVVASHFFLASSQSVFNVSDLSSGDEVMVGKHGYEAEIEAIGALKVMVGKHGYELEIGAIGALKDNQLQKMRNCTKEFSWIGLPWTDNPSLVFRNPLQQETLGLLIPFQKSFVAGNRLHVQNSNSKPFSTALFHSSLLVIDYTS
ncbi:hypothetical protein D0Y65_004296 [Glycine soja]|uniref:Uncharacterized protein n=1 Tax=Glycine soja TaxID=3848 RepID=A0A445LQT3_GLYSO|nr:hypothetical protein D0Y65_004296 [Glycine soja]